MNLKTLPVGVLACIMLLAANTFAQSEKENIVLKPFSLGIRAEAFNLSDLNFSNSVVNKSIIATYNLNQKIRFDGEFGFGFQNYSDSESKSMGLKMGIGAFGMTQKGKLNFYYGLRVAYGHNSRNEEDFMTQEWETKTQKIYTLSPTVGAEYFLTNQFSIGAEFSLNVNFSDNQMWDEGKSTLINTNSSVVLRYYF